MFTCRFEKRHGKDTAAGRVRYHNRVS